MNQIRINLKNGECINLIDSDNTPKNELEDNLSSLFSINNIAIVKTEDISVIIRPSDISSISVEDIKDPIIIKPQPKKISPPPKKEPQVSIDIIKDID